MQSVVVASTHGPWKKILGRSRRTSTNISTEGGSERARVREYGPGQGSVEGRCQLCLCCVCDFEKWWGARDLYLLDCTACLLIYPLCLPPSTVQPAIARAEKVDLRALISVPLRRKHHQQ